MRKRLSEHERRREILEAARTCFLELGFASTTMEAIIARTSLSKGGVYRYYASTTDMLVDLMKAGTAYRFARIQEDQAPPPSAERAEQIDWMTDILYRKIVDENPYKRLYALFLIESGNNAELATLKEALEEDFFRQLSEVELFPPELAQALHHRALIEYLNAMLVGVEIIGMRETFLRYPEFLKSALRSYFESALARAERRYHAAP